MMKDFVYKGLPSRVVFGNGFRAKVAEEAALLNIKKPMIICTPFQNEQAEEVAKYLKSFSPVIYDQAVMHVPVETIQDALKVVKENNIDGFVCIGGGSTIGLAKALVLELELPILALPTTFAGSEMTPVWGKTENGVKTTGRDLRVLPKTVIYDPELTYTLPAHIAGPSGINAMAHAVEALYSEQTNPVISLMAEESIRALGKSLLTIVSEPDNKEARSDALYGAWLASNVLGNVGMALHHKLCHTLGGSFNLPHGDVHKVILPYAVYYNCDHAPEAMAAIGRALGVDANQAASAIYQLSAKLAGPISLKELGMSESDLDKAAEIAGKNPYYNPRPVISEDIRHILQMAFDGVEPV
jgi:maleylacetate reductase